MLLLLLHPFTSAQMTLVVVLLLLAQPTVSAVLQVDFEVER